MDSSRRVTSLIAWSDAGAAGAAEAGAAEEAVGGGAEEAAGGGVDGAAGGAAEEAGGGAVLSLSSGLDHWNHCAGCAMIGDGAAHHYHPLKIPS